MIIAVTIIGTIVMVMTALIIVNYRVKRDRSLRPYIKSKLVLGLRKLV